MSSSNSEGTVIAVLTFTDEAEPVDKEDLVEYIIPGYEGDETPFEVNKLDEDTVEIIHPTRE